MILGVDQLRILLLKVVGFGVVVADGPMMMLVEAVVGAFVS